jgi:lipopolysaccharide transport system ATP-binding protein
MPRLFLSAHVVDEAGMVIAQCDSRLLGLWVDGLDRAGGTFSLASPWLRPGSYQLDLFLCAIGHGVVDLYERACLVKVLPLLPYGHVAPPDALEKGCVLPSFDWKLETV